MPHIINNATLNRILEAAEVANSQGRVDTLLAIDRFLSTMFYPLSLIPHS